MLPSLSQDYRIRVLTCLAAALSIVLAVVKLWPVRIDADSADVAYHASKHEVINLEEIQQTRQANAVPPPPAPPIPILVPDDLVLEDHALELSESLLTLEQEGDLLFAGDGPDEAGSPAASGPTVGPKTMRFVEPEYTREARRKRIRAELVVEVLVDERGRVQDSQVVERFLLGEDGGSRMPVDALGYGLEEAALSAADRWVFRPARKNGKPVASHTTLTFTFGVDA